MTHDGLVVQGFAYGNIPVNGLSYQKRHLSTPKKCIKNIWIMQPHQEMVLYFLRKSEITLGVAAEERHKSKNDKFARKKYMGE